MVNLKPMKIEKEVYSDGIDKEWIYMLEDKLVYEDNCTDKIIKHRDFLEVVAKWKALRKEAEEIPQMKKVKSVYSLTKEELERLKRHDNFRGLLKDYNN